MKKKLILPKIEVVRTGRKTTYLVNGEKKRPTYNSGIRPKLIMPELGIIIKFQHRFYKHYDHRVYKKISRYDRRFFPKVLADTDDYSVHEFVPHYKIKAWEHQAYIDAAYKLKSKYDFHDFGYRQFGVRKDSGKLVYFDYGLI